ncbi:MAG: type III-A CRISPR-associated protein Csm2 [Thermodesulfobacteriota bacterium]
MNGANRTERLPTLREWGKDMGIRLSDLSKVDATTLVKVAEEVGRFLVNGRYSGRGDRESRMSLKMNQIRRFLDAVRRIEADLKNSKTRKFEELSDSVILLRPKLAYAAGREEQVIPLVNVLDPAIQSGAKSKENFTKLLRLIEGIIAYHRFAGGSN